MEIKIVIDDTLICRVRQYFRRIGLVLLALLATIPMLLLARSAMNEYGLTVFNPGSVISSDAVNANFDLLARQSDTLQSSVDSLEAAITVDGNNSVGIGSTSPSANLDVKGNLSKALSGTVTVGGGKTEVSGTNTKFKTELTSGNAIQIGAELFVVASIADDLKLTLDSVHQTGALNAVAYTDTDLLSIQNGDGARKLVVDKSGNVGVGSATPTAKLQVDGARRAFAVNGSWGGEDFANPVAKIVSTDSGVTESGTLFNRKNGALNFDLLNVHYQGSSRLFVHSDGNVGIGTTSPNAKLEVAGDARFGCRPGFWAVADGRICVESTLRGPGDAWNAIGTCKSIAPGCRVCTHTDLQQACGSGVANPYGSAMGWFGDHGVADGGNWDDEFGTWNVNGCSDNSDDGAYQAASKSLPYRCCY